MALVPPHELSYPFRMWDSLIVLVRVVALVYIGLVLVLAGCQRAMIYYPARASESEAMVTAAGEGMSPWRNDDGDIIGWRSRTASDDADAILIFHGNAGFAAHRGYFARGLYPEFTVYIFEYPGYGTRSGRPSEPNFYAAAEDAVKQLSDEHDGRIFLGGESLGSGVATYLAGTQPDHIAGLFLVTPFTSLVDVARSHYPIFPVRWLMRDRYESARHLENYEGPVAILVAGRDEIVPAKFGQKLYDGYDGPKRIWNQEDRTHNTLDYGAQSPWWDEVVTFLTRTTE